MTSYTLAGLQDGQTYYITATAYSASGEESDFANEWSGATEAAPPVANFTAAPTTGSAPLNVVFTDTSTGLITGWQWNFGDGTSSTTRHPSHTYSTPGTYSVGLSVSGPGGTHTQTRTNLITVVAPPPVASFTAAPTTGSAPLDVVFTDTSTGSITGWQWNFGDGTSSATRQPSHTYSTPGTYSVVLSVSGPGGTHTYTRANLITVVAAPPVASFTAIPTTGPAPLNVVFTNTSTGTMTGWQWNFGDGTSSTARQPSHVYASAGQYTVSLTASGPGGSHTTTQPNRITVAPESVRIWLEGEAGDTTSQMEVGSDSTASAGQYVAVPDGNGTLTDPSQEGGLVQYTFTVPAADAYVVWGRVRPSATGTGSFYLALEEQADSTAGTPSVTGVIPQHYLVAPLTVGSVYYADRAYTITHMAPELQGRLAIKTGNNDKANTALNYLSFTLSHAATLYVAYDSTASRYPSWLTSAFTRTTLELRTTDKPMTVWKQEVAAGPVTLPGNLSGGALGATSNYLVLFDFHTKSGTSSPLTEIPFTRWTIPSSTAGANPGTGSITGVIPQRYLVAPLTVGSVYYIDRAYTITKMAPELQGRLAIKTGNNDKSNTALNYLSFTLSHAATLYVAYDSTATRYPSWLTSAFTRTTLELRTTDKLLTVWKRAVAAGPVTLPGNLSGGALNATSNYLVFVDFGASSQTPAPQAWVWDQAAADTTPVFFLSEGTYTLSIKQRESGTKLDRLLITNDVEYKP